MGRESYLLEGRRVTVGDLLEAQYLDVGAKLTFERPRRGEKHQAEVAAGGKLRLPDGQLFRSPSRAAIAAVGGGSFDGWHAWVLGDGKTLDELRQRLLDEAAEEVSKTPDEVETGNELFTPAERHEKLKRARQLADAGKPLTLTVREIVGWWGAMRRGYLITKQIDAELANHSLTTLPDFEKVHFDSTVQLVTTAQEEKDDAEEVVPTSALVADAPPLDLDDEDEPETGLTVGNLPSALSEVTSVPPDATYEQAITLMVINDYSQLPVISGRNVRGAVTWKSIARARHAKPDATFSDAIITAREVSYDHDLIDILPALADSEFVLVRDQTQRIAGIVTASDVAAAYGSLASPFFLVGELDQRLRRVMTRTFKLPDVQDNCDPQGQRGITSFDDLSIGDYQRALENPALWSQLGWPLDRKVFGKRLGEIRIIRNDLMHFNPDPLPDDAIQKIRNMIALLREYGS
ncbi:MULTISPECIES: restriction system modified-DNA reader domain-containing protein [unclassified Streptomyces]|uniref:restriction system modified-DNA reader domain-containing protein n=1 Tax=Streptomyces sp. NPDC127532 TaxID=3345399 RepID=UPI0036323C1A